MIIGLTGKSGSGKDTAAAYLVRELSFTRVAFADKLKEAAREIFGFSWQQLHGAKRDEVDDYWEMKPSTVLQLLGTECVRDGFANTPVGEDIWIKAALRDRLRGIDYVFTDVRYPNEALALTNIGGRILRITRPEHASTRAPHASETAMDSYPCDTIENIGSVVELERAIARWLK